MSLAVIAGLCACLAVPVKPAFALFRASAVVLEQEQPGGSGQSSAPAQPVQQPSQEKTASQTAPESAQPQPATSEKQPATNPQSKPEPGAGSQPGLQPPIAPPALPPPTTTPKSAKKPAAKVGAKSAVKKPVAAKHAASKTKTAAGPAKVVVSNGGAADPKVEFTPTVTKQQANAALQNTNNLLDATEDNLKKLSSRQLSAPQQDIVKQIRAYMQQAKTAAGDGDVQQATNLAAKARMLSDELVKP